MTPGDSVAFYRVYRDGRYFDRTATGTDLQLDRRQAGERLPHLHLKAVDTHLAESPALDLRDG